jgi:hypothetical protein
MDYKIKFKHARVTITSPALPTLQEALHHFMHYLDVNDTKTLKLAEVYKGDELVHAIVWKEEVN